MNVTPERFMGMLKAVKWGGNKLECGLKVDGSLDLRGTAITTLPDNLTVGGWLYLSGTAITTLPDNLTVGGWLDLRGTFISKEASRMVNKIVHGTVTDKYVFADDILTHIKAVKMIGDITAYIAPYSAVVATRDGETFAHGRTIREAINDLRFKEAERKIEEYRGLDFDSVLEFEDAVIMFRVITGACSYGTERFLEENKVEKRPYSVGEILELTKSQYGHETFADFFKEGE